jgi:hypothetical protein
MERKLLGKIESVDVRLIEGYLLGLDMTFKLGEGGGIGSGGMYTVNINNECRWEKAERSTAMEAAMDMIAETLKIAKVDCVAKLKNMPVEVMVSENCFKSFRILTEVL